MGLCGSSNKANEDPAGKAKSQAIDKDMTKIHSAEMQVNKLLLLGAGESGKSTLFKQMINIYGKGFSEDERKEFIPIIFTNVIGSMKTLCEQSDELKAKFSTSVHPSLEPSKNYVLEMKELEQIEPRIAAHFQALWRDKGIQTTYEHRSLYQLIDSTAYFLDKIMEIAQPAYVPSEQDVLRSRVRTTGIVENEFVIDGNRFKMFDVGGQRNERKKWIHCFSEVTAVLFVAALSAYDLVLYEDEDTNRMEEALNLFGEICNSRWFKKTSMILMLNKRDLFAEKIQKTPLTVTFKEYKGNPHDYQQCVEYVKSLFEGKRADAAKPIYTHVCCATDKDNMRHVFAAVKDIVIRKSLAEGGLLPVY